MCSGAWKAGSRSIFLCLALAVHAHLTPSRADAQQFVTDDAAIVEHRACQLEAWHGERKSWIIPACQAIRNLEISAGLGWLADDGARATEWLLEGQYLLREEGSGMPAVALVAGVEFASLSRLVGNGLPDAFVYVPVSATLAGDRVMVHGNLGWHVERDEHEHDGVAHVGAHHALTWAFRGDFTVSERFTLIGETFGENRQSPEFQVGVRSALLADRLMLDISWGGHTAPDERGLGWTAGFVWTPPPFF
jgi:hypothetical protein